ncbi:MAG: hypothetical protein A4E32_01643 [Methanomassiliicoccales archaeon PtaU1.Bin124]|nr:MAG: hypothetical protein A4E32_01643 [Methanomassiliicoccales archaeon PtaU1.Bin124]
MSESPTNSSDTFFLDQGKVILHVDSGVCRFDAHIECWLNEDGTLGSAIKSNCPHVKEFAEALGSCDMMAAMKMPFSENQVYMVGGRTLRHSTCPVPMAVLKGFEAASGLALKRTVTVTFK